MRVFVAGATGALGLPLVRALVARGHHVVGMTRSPSKRDTIARLGAEPVVADALDGKQVETAVRASRPTHVVHALTALPATGPMRISDLRPTDALRTTGTRNLLHAAVAAGARRIVGESMVLAYGFGDHGPVPKVESDFLSHEQPRPWLRPTVDAVRSMEEQMLAANATGDIEAIPLRYGFFYGPTGATEYILRMLRRRRMPTIRGIQGAWPYIHMHDAVAAAIAALEQGVPGEVYNVVDDEPVSFNEFLLRAAASIGAPPPRSVPLGVVRLLAPYVAYSVSTRLAVCNAKAKRALGWSLQFPTTREGLAALEGAGG
jgi:nucleoside-diphosphate-sugar epimerase